MKKTMSLLLVAGLSWFTVGCSSDPGTTVETDMTDTEMDEMEGVLDVASEAGLEGGAPAEGAPAAEGATAEEAPAE